MPDPESAQKLDYKDQISLNFWTLNYDCWIEMLQVLCIGANYVGKVVIRNNL